MTAREIDEWVDKYGEEALSKMKEGMKREGLEMADERDFKMFGLGVVVGQEHKTTAPSTMRILKKIASLIGVLSVGVLVIIIFLIVKFV